MSDLSHLLNPIAGALSGAPSGAADGALWPAPLEGGYPAWAPRDGGLPCIVESRIGRRYGGQLTALDLGSQVALLRSNRGPQVVTLRFDQLRSLTLGERLQPQDPAAPRPPTRPLTLGNARGAQLQCEALSPLTLGGGVFVYQPVDTSAQLQCSFHPGLQVMSAPPAPTADAADTLPAALMLMPPPEAATDAGLTADRADGATETATETGTATETATGDGAEAEAEAKAEREAAHGALGTHPAQDVDSGEDRRDGLAAPDIDHGMPEDAALAPTTPTAPAARRTVVAPLAAWVERAEAAERHEQAGRASGTGTTSAAPLLPHATGTAGDAAAADTADGQSGGRSSGQPSNQPHARSHGQPSGREPTLTDVLPADTLPAALMPVSLAPSGPAAARASSPTPSPTLPRPSPPRSAGVAAQAQAHAQPAPTTSTTARTAIDSLLAEAPTLPMSFDLGPTHAAPPVPRTPRLDARHSLLDLAPTEPAVLHEQPHDATLPMPLDERPDARHAHTAHTHAHTHTADRRADAPIAADRSSVASSIAAATAAAPASTSRLPRLDTDLQLSLTDLGDLGTETPSTATPLPVAVPVPVAVTVPATAPVAVPPSPPLTPPAADPERAAGPRSAALRTAVVPADPPPAVQDLATLHARLDAPSAPAMRLGEALMALGALSEAQLGDALQAQARGPGLALGELLLRGGMIDRTMLRTALTCKLGYVPVDLHTLTPQDDALRALPTAQCRQHRALPLCWHGDALVMALDDPSARIVVDRLEQLAQAPVRAVACDGDALDEALARLPDDRAAGGRLSGPVLTTGPGTALATPQADDTGTPAPTDDGRPALATLDPDDEDLLADRLIAAALDAQAEDLHIHCDTQGVALQLRQAGALRPWHSLPAAAAAPLMRRLHQLAGVDEPRPATPATHGRIALARCLPGQRGDARLQTLRRADGGRDGVLRLPATAPRCGLAALGVSRAMQDDLRLALGRRGGLLLRVGTAGSGRRTGVRAMLAELASPQRRLWQGLAEDQEPTAERAGLRQVRLRPQQGWSAESALKALAHADADVVAIEGLDAPADLLAALDLARATPTRVLGTLGAADALDALARLQSAGAPGWALAEGLRGLWSTRLLPRCCPACRQARPAGPEWEQALLRLWSEDATRGEAGAETQLRRWRAEHGRDGQLLQWEAPGCARCEGRGTEGWVGVHELLLPGAGLRQALRESQSPGSWWTIARADGWQPMRRDLLLKLLGGQIGADALHACG
ncbi:MAG: hypothetical protein RLY78_3429 [Pseudomonadota bacterium]